MTTLGKKIIIRGLYTLSTVLAFLTIYLFVQNIQLWSRAGQEVENKGAVEIVDQQDFYVERQYAGLLIKQKTLEKTKDVIYSFDLDNEGLSLSGLTLTIVYDPTKLESPEVNTTIKTLSIPKKGIKETFDETSQRQFLTFNILSENIKGINQPLIDIVKIKFKKLLPIAANYSIEPAFYLLPTTFEDIVQPNLKSIAKRLFVIDYPSSQGILVGTSFLVRLDVVMEKPL